MNGERRKKRAKRRGGDDGDAALSATLPSSSSTALPFLLDQYILVLVFGMLGDSKSVLAASAVCKRWRQAALSPQVWRATAIEIRTIRGLGAFFTAASAASRAGAYFAPMQSKCLCVSVAYPVDDDQDELEAAKLAKADVVLSCRTRAILEWLCGLEELELKASRKKYDDDDGDGGVNVVDSRDGYDRAPPLSRRRKRIQETVVNTALVAIMLGCGGGSSKISKSIIISSSSIGNDGENGKQSTLRRLSMSVDSEKAIEAIKLACERSGADIVRLLLPGYSIALDDDDVPCRSLDYVKDVIRNCCRSGLERFCISGASVGVLKLLGSTASRKTLSSLEIDSVARDGAFALGEPPVRLEALRSLSVREACYGIGSGLDMESAGKTVTSLSLAVARGYASSSAYSAIGRFLAELPSVADLRLSIRDEQNKGVDGFGYGHGAGCCCGCNALAAADEPDVAAVGGGGGGGGGEKGGRGGGGCGVGRIYAERLSSLAGMAMLRSADVEIWDAPLSVVAVLEYLGAAPLLRSLTVRFKKYKRGEKASDAAKIAADDIARSVGTVFSGRLHSVSFVDGAGVSKDAAVAACRALVGCSRGGDGDGGDGEGEGEGEGVSAAAAAAAAAAASTASVPDHHPVSFSAYVRDVVDFGFDWIPEVFCNDDDDDDDDDYRTTTATTARMHSRLRRRPPVINAFAERVFISAKW